MTRQQQAEMDELGLTPEKLAARQERLKGILGATADQIVAGSALDPVIHGGTPTEGATIGFLNESVAEARAKLDPFNGSFDENGDLDMAKAAKFAPLPVGPFAGFPAKPTRAPRSDKGTKRVKPQPPAPAEVPGAITQEQKDRLVELILIRDARKQDMEAAEAEYEDSNRAMVSFLDALTGK